MSLVLGGGCNCEQGLCSIHFNRSGRSPKTYKGLMMEQRMNAEKTAPARAEHHNRVERELGEAYREHVRGPRFAVVKQELDLANLGGPKFDPAVHTQRDVYQAMMQAFQQVGPDLGLEIEDPSDPAFQDWFRDNASDAGIPPEMAEAALNGDSGRKKAMIKRAVHQKLAVSLEAAIELSEEFHRYGGPTYEQLVAVVNDEPLEEQNSNALRQIVEILENVARHDDELADEVEDLVAEITEHLDGDEDEDEVEEPEELAEAAAVSSKDGLPDVEGEEPMGGPGNVEAALDAAMKEAVTPPGRVSQKQVSMDFGPVIKWLQLGEKARNPKVIAKYMRGSQDMIWAALYQDAESNGDGELGEMLLDAAGRNGVETDIGNPPPFLTSDDEVEAQHLTEEGVQFIWLDPASSKVYLSIVGGSVEAALDAALKEAVHRLGDTEEYPVYPDKTPIRVGDRVKQTDADGVTREGVVAQLWNEGFGPDDIAWQVRVEWPDMDEGAVDAGHRNIEKLSSTHRRQAVTPPGREKQVKKLKSVPGVKNPWAVAWGQYAKKHKSSVEAALDAAMAERQPKFAATDFPPGRAVAQQVKDQGSAMSFLDRVKAKGQAWLDEFFQKLRSEGFEDEAMMLENASKAIPGDDLGGAPGEAVPGFEPISTRAAPEILARQMRLNKQTNKQAANKLTASDLDRAIASLRPIAEQEQQAAKEWPEGFIDIGLWSDRPFKPSDMKPKTSEEQVWVQKWAPIWRANTDKVWEILEQIPGFDNMGSPEGDWGIPVSDPEESQRYGSDLNMTGSMSGDFPAVGAIEVLERAKGVLGPTSSGPKASPTPKLTSKKQAAKDDGLADEIDVDGYPARILKRIGHIGGKEALRVELIDGPRKGEVVVAVEG